MELQEKKKNRTEQKTEMQNKEKALLTQLDEIAKQDTVWHSPAVWTAVCC